MNPSVSIFAPSSEKVTGNLGPALAGLQPHAVVDLIVSGLGNFMQNAGLH